MKFGQYKIFILMIFLFFLGAKQSYASKAAPWVGVTFSGAPCRGPSQGYGPYDYTQRNSIPKHHLHIVEKAHFTPQVENLVEGMTTRLPGDITYTIKAWPNHHRALHALSRFKLLFPNKRASSKSVPTECYFQRAINYSRKDATTRMLYAMYLHKTKHKKMAIMQYETAIKISPQDPVIRYNFGLLLFNLKKYDLAQEQAIIAYNANFPLTGLKNKLKRVKYWPPKQVIKTSNSKITTPKNITKQ